MLHIAGLTDQDVIANRTTGGLQYTGQALALAKAVGDSGPGGMTVLSLAAFEAWKHERAGKKGKPARSDQGSHDEDPLLILHMGCYKFRKVSDLDACTLYMAVPRALECRLALGRTALRNVEQLATGVLQAPIGTVSVAFCTMVGYSTLLAWNEDLAKSALAEYNKLASELLMHSDAYATLGPGKQSKTRAYMRESISLHVR